MHIVDVKLFTIGNITLSLNLNGLRDKCAGVVEFSTTQRIFGVCNDKWVSGQKQDLFYLLFLLYCPKYEREYLNVIASQKKSHLKANDA